MAIMASIAGLKDTYAQLKTRMDKAVEDFRKAMAQLPPEQREVLTLVGASGLSYEEAAAICRVEIGTIKSRLSRARARLVELLGLDETGGAAAERKLHKAKLRRYRASAPTPL